MRIDQLCDQYERWADSYYRKPSGKPTRHANNVRDALRLLRHTVLDGGGFRVRVARLRLEQFTPAVLRAIQQDQDSAGRVTRKTINARIAEIRRCFDWAAERELIGDDQVRRLERVKHLKRGRCQAPEGRGVRAVSWERVSDTLAVAPRMLAAMIELHWYTGMRPAELVAIRWSLIDTRGDDWIYYPAEDKTEHHRSPEQRKRIPLGPACQTILRNQARRWDGDGSDSGRRCSTPTASPSSTARRSCSSTTHPPKTT